MKQVFKIGDQFDLVESLGIAYKWDQSIAPKGKQLVVKASGSIGYSLVMLGDRMVKDAVLWIGKPYNKQVTEVKPIGRFTITSLKNKHN